MYQISIITALVAGMAAAVSMMKKRLPKRLFGQMIWLMFAVYIAGNLYFTLLSRVPGSGTQLDLQPFQTYAKLFEWREAGFENATGFAAAFLKDTSPFVGVFLNVLLYCPLGYLLHILFPKLKPRYIVLIGCLCSVATEATQYFFKMGWCETDDVIHNTLGTAAGIWLWNRQLKSSTRGGHTDD